MNTFALSIYFFFLIIETLKSMAAINGNISSANHFNKPIDVIGVTKVNFYQNEQVILFSVLK